MIGSVQVNHLRICTKNSKGPKILPCGTPENTDKNLEYVLVAELQLIKLLSYDDLRPTQFYKWVQGDVAESCKSV